MSSLNLDDRRPCYVYVDWSNSVKAMFHCWSHETKFLPRSSYQVNDTFGIVEFEDGTLGRVKPESIRFVDGGGFNEIAFPPQN